MGAAIWLLGPVCVVLLIAGCARLPRPTASPQPSAVFTPSPKPSPSSSPAPTASARDFVTRSWGYWSFEAPADWQMLGVARAWMGVEPRLFLSNAPIAHPCPTRPTDVTHDCWKPLDRLPANGVLVSFTNPRGVVPPEWSGEVHESQATLWCEEIWGERQLSTVFPMAGITACLRGPDFAVNEAAFRNLASSYEQLSEPSPFPQPSDRS